MDDERSRQALDVLRMVVDVEPARRPARLDDLCAGDVGLRAQVEAPPRCGLLAGGEGEAGVGLSPEVENFEGVDLYPFHSPTSPLAASMAVRTS